MAVLTAFRAPFPVPIGNRALQASFGEPRQVSLRRSSSENPGVAVLTLITGGVRSGKSRIALELARQRAQAKAFIATAQALDPEMKSRIARHRADRGADFFTIEEPVDLSAAIKEAARRSDLILIDCLNLWVTNLLTRFDKDQEIMQEFEKLLLAIQESPTHFLFVTNEAGLGIMPDNALARRYIDLLGTLNQRMAEASDEVIWMITGLPQWIKGGVHARLDR